MLAAPDLTLTWQRPAVKADADWLDEQVLAIHRRQLGIGDDRLGVFVRDGAGMVVAGASCVPYGTDLFVHLLWVEPWRRGNGLGFAVLQAVEHAGRTRGMTRIFLSTLTFQAPGFYPKAGFVELGRAPAMLHGADFHYFRKNITQGDPPTLPPGLTLEITDTPADADIQVVDDGLTQHWHTKVTEESQRWCLLAAAADARPVAGCHIARDGGDSRILSLWVAPDRRGRGLGGRLLARAEEALRQEGVRTLVVLPHPWQSPDFFQRRGFGAVLHIPDYVLGHPRWWLRKSLLEVS